DQQGQVTLCNPAAEQVSRGPSASALGQSFATFLTEEARHVLADAMQHQPSASQPTLWLPEGLHAVRADGEVFPMEATLSRGEVAGQPFFTVILRDVQARHQADAERHALQDMNAYLQGEVRAAYQVGDLVGN